MGLQKGLKQHIDSWDPNPKKKSWVEKNSNGKKCKFINANRGYEKNIDLPKFLSVEPG